MTPLIKRCGGDWARKHVLIIHIQTCLLNCYEENIENFSKIYNEHIKNTPKIYNEPIENPPKITNNLRERIQKFLKNFRKYLDVVYTQNPSIPALDLVKEDFPNYNYF